MKKFITCLMIIFTLVCTIDTAFAKKAPKEETPKTKKELKTEKVSPQRNTTIESTRKRTALGIYLNPNLDVQEIRASHILVKKRKDAVKIRKDILAGNITFEDAAREYSLCPTGVKGGDLGYFNRKRMDQNFADRAFDLKIGEISEPVGTKFGWHLIKVYDKR